MVAQGGIDKPLKLLRSICRTGEISMLAAKVKYGKLLIKLGIVLVLLTVTIPAIFNAPAMAHVQYIQVQPDHGPVGTRVHVYGSSFTPSVLSDNASANVTAFAKIYFPEKLALVRTTNVDVWGNFETYFDVGQCPAGVYSIWAYDVSASSPVWVSAKFRVEPRVELSGSSGYVGDNITAGGTGFSANSTATVYFDNLSVATAITSQNGTFTQAAITIPASVNGSHNIRAVDTTANQSTATFLTKQKVTVSPASAAMGEEVTINGSGFAANQLITVLLDYDTVATSPALVKTSPNGSFTGKFYVPTCAVNTYTLEASDGSNRAGSTFVVVAGGTMDRIVGYVGSNVTFNGAGFVPGRIAVIYYDTVKVAEATVDANGNLSASFKVPISSSGNHTVSINDGTNTMEKTFTVLLAATGQMNRVIGYVGSDVTFSGSGFIPDRIVTLYYSAVEVAETTVDASGAFTASFKVPASSSGNHTVLATDGTISANCTFAMESTAPPAPALLLPANGSEVEPEATRLVWEGVTDPSGVTYTLHIASSANFTSGNATTLVLEKSQLTAAEYTLTLTEKLEPTKKGASYYFRVRAVDKASNVGEWSAVREFYVGGSGAPTSPWFLYSVVVEGITFSGLFSYWLVKRRAWS